MLMLSGEVLLIVCLVRCEDASAVHEHNMCAGVANLVLHILCPFLHNKRHDAA